jgi:hypothetical protein
MKDENKKEIYGEKSFPSSCDPRIIDERKKKKGERR